MPSTDKGISKCFERGERLKSEKAIEALFREGKSFVAHPLRVVWLPVAQIPTRQPFLPPYPAQAAFTASKRVFKTAVLRNRIKRLMREAYRLHKHELYAFLREQDSGGIVVIFSFIGKSEPDFSEIEAGVIKMIRKFSGQWANFSQIEKASADQRTENH